MATDGAGDRGKEFAHAERTPLVEPLASAELVILSGLQAAGKTSFYQAHFAATHVHVSKDAWPNVRRKNERQQRLVHEHLRAGRAVVVDNTNPSPVERGPLVAIARELGVPVHSYAFIVSVEEALRRNAGREGKARIPAVGIFVAAKRLVMPSADEGFDRRFEVQLGPDGFVIRAVAAIAPPERDDAGAVQPPARTR